MMKRLLLIGMLGSGSAAAHEFWIEPLEYTLSSQQPLQAQVRSGEGFVGEEYPFMPERIVHAELIDNAERQLLLGRAGEFPAINVEVGNGLQIVSYQSTSSELTHQEFSSFREFLEADGLLWVEEAHQQRKLPVAGFREQFTRYAKSLVSVDGAAGRDQLVGLPYELLVLSPLYDTDTPQEIGLQLLIDGRPIEDTQVTIFQKAPDETEEQKPIKIRTDNLGKVMFPVVPGNEYLASAVIMTEGQSAPWHSHWTSVTFSTL